MTIAFIACSKAKNRVPCEAEKMYQGTLFKKALDYCKKYFDMIFILSAKYGLIGLHDVIEPYELTLNSMSSRQRMDWADMVKKQIGERRLNGEFWFFTGRKYHEHFSGYKPLEGLDIGKSLQWFNQHKQRKGFDL